MGRPPVTAMGSKVKRGSLVTLDTQDFLESRVTLEKKVTPAHLEKRVILEQQDVLD